MSSKRMLLFSRKGRRERVPTTSKALSPLIPLCGLDFVLVAHARHSLSKLNSALAYSQIYSPLAHQASQVSFLLLLLIRHYILLNNRSFLCALLDCALANPNAKFAQMTSLGYSFLCKIITEIAILCTIFIKKHINSSF